MTIIYVSIAVVILGVSGGLFIFQRNRSHQAPLAFPASSTPVPDVNQLIADLRSSKLTVNDLRIRRSIDDACRNTEEFFRRVRAFTPSEVEGYNMEFGRMLNDLQKVVTIGANAERAKTGDEQAWFMTETRKAISGYTDYVVSSTARIGQADMIPFRVISQELAAKAFK